MSTECQEPAERFVPLRCLRLASGALPPEADLAFGRSEGVAAELAAWVATYPDTAWRQLPDTPLDGDVAELTRCFTARLARGGGAG